jgi:hypothetical protein
MPVRVNSFFCWVYRQNQSAIHPILILIGSIENLAAGYYWINPGQSTNDSTKLTQIKKPEQFLPAFIS